MARQVGWCQKFRTINSYYSSSKNLRNSVCVVSTFVGCCVYTFVDLWSMTGHALHFVAAAAGVLRLGELALWMLNVLNQPTKLKVSKTDQNNEKGLLWCEVSCSIFRIWRLISNMFKLEFSNLMSSKSKNPRRFLNTLCHFYSH